MNDIIIKKSNGIVLKSNKIDDRPYIDNSDSFIKLVFVNKQDVELIRRKVDYILNDIYNYYSKNTISELYNNLKVVKNKEDIKKLILLVLNYFDIVIETKYDFNIKYTGKVDNKLKDDLKVFLEKKEDLVMSIFIKSLISKYFYYRLLSFDNSTLSKLERLKASKKYSDSLLEFIGEVFIEDYNFNGIRNISLNIVKSLLDKIFISKQSNICWNCKNAVPSNCQKVADIVKKDISNYEFIIKGYQLYTNDELESFVVSKCSNFEKEDRKDNKERLNILKDELLESYKKYEVVANNKAKEEAEYLVNKVPYGHRCVKRKFG